MYKQLREREREREREPFFQFFFGRNLYTISFKISTQYFKKCHSQKGTLLPHFFDGLREFCVWMIFRMGIICRLLLCQMVSESTSKVVPELRWILNRVSRFTMSKLGHPNTMAIKRIFCLAWRTFCIGSCDIPTLLCQLIDVNWWTVRPWLVWTRLHLRFNTHEQTTEILPRKFTKPLASHIILYIFLLSRFNEKKKGFHKIFLSTKGKKRREKVTLQSTSLICEMPDMSTLGNCKLLASVEGI